jgi:Flp pilus assembly pilin Flp
LLALVNSIQLVLDRVRARLAGNDGQTSVEYALVLLGAAAIALLVGAWAGGTDKVTNLLDAMFDQVVDTAGG